MSSAYIAIGLLASSLTSNQIVAFLMALLIGVVFQFIMGALGSSQPGWLGGLLTDLSVPEHFESMSRGVIDSKDLIYFASITVLGLAMTRIAISNRK